MAYNSLMEYYQSTKKELPKETLSEEKNLPVSWDDMLTALQDASGKDKKFDEALWNWFEENMSDSGIYAGDATPDDYLDEMSETQIKACFKELSKKFKNLLKIKLKESTESLEESDENEYTWSKSELIEFISSLTAEEVHEVGEFIWSELMYNEETDDYDDLEDEDFEDEDTEELEESASDETLTEIKFFDKKKAQVDREKRKNVALRKRKSKLLAKYYKKNRAKIARKAKLYRKKAKRNPNKIKHHKGVQY